jgi:hypothetical protein
VVVLVVARVSTVVPAVVVTTRGETVNEAVPVSDAGSVAVKATEPVKPLTGVMVKVAGLEVEPLVAVMLEADEARVKSAAVAEVMLINSVLEDAAKTLSPE